MHAVPNLSSECYELRDVAADRIQLCCSVFLFCTYFPTIPLYTSIFTAFINSKQDQSNQVNKIASDESSSRVMSSNEVVMTCHLDTRGSRLQIDAEAVLHDTQYFEACFSCCPCIMRMQRIHTLRGQVYVLTQVTGSEDVIEDFHIRV